MNGATVLDSYQKHQNKLSAKHLNKQWDHPDKAIKSKEDFYAAMSKKKKPEDLEAILALEEELWNS